VRLPGAVVLLLAPFALFGLLGASGCATAPFFRPQGPPLNDRVAEVGVGAHAAFGRDRMGVGTGGWLHAQVMPDVELVLRGHGTDFFRYDGAGRPLDDLLAGGSIGLRGRYRYSPTLLLGGELLLDYQARTGESDEQLLSGIFGIPVAEEAAPGLWVYTNISLGIAVALHDNPAVPFFGFQEIPIGLSWQATDWLVIAAEGGFSLPLNGGYAGAAAAFRF
jgi:hypothetical protein